MVLAAHPHWKRQRPSAKTRAAVLWALRANAQLTARDLASEANLPWRRVCAALDDLVIHGAVELEDGKYRRLQA